MKTFALLVVAIAYKQHKIDLAADGILKQTNRMRTSLERVIDTETALKTRFENEKEGVMDFFSKDANVETMLENLQLGDVVEYDEDCNEIVTSGIAQKEQERDANLVSEQLYIPPQWTSFTDTFGPLTGYGYEQEVVPTADPVVEEHSYYEAIGDDDYLDPGENSKNKKAALLQKRAPKTAEKAHAERKWAPSDSLVQKDNMDDLVEENACEDNTADESPSEDDVPEEESGAAEALAESSMPVDGAGWGEDDLGDDEDEAFAAEPGKKAIVSLVEISKRK